MEISFVSVEWYFIVLIFYVVLILINVSVAFFETRTYGFWSSLLVFLTMFVIGLLVTPFLWLVVFYELLTFDRHGYETFTIHELTEDNKTTLRNLGFQEGNFVSNENCDFSGFRVQDNLNIKIQYNGRVAVKYLYALNKEQKIMIKLIKNLPRCVEVDETEIEKEK